MICGFAIVEIDFSRLYLIDSKTVIVEVSDHCARFLDIPPKPEPIYKWVEQDDVRDFLAYKIRQQIDHDTIEKRVDCKPRLHMTPIFSTRKRPSETRDMSPFDHGRD